jgi:hypothetical protein
LGNGYFTEMVYGVRELPVSIPILLPIQFLRNGVPSGDSKDATMGLNPRIPTNIIHLFELAFVEIYLVLWK